MTVLANKPTTRLVMNLLRPMVEGLRRKERGKGFGEERKIRRKADERSEERRRNGGLRQLDVRVGCFDDDPET